MNPPRSLWQFRIDRGDTFTDVIACRPDGTLSTLKLLSENPERYADAAIEGIRELMVLAPGAPIPVHDIAAVKMGTTVATNALLERKGEPTVLAITKGFRDQLRIGYQNRPRIFDRQIRLPSLLYGEVIELDERLDAAGAVVKPLDAAAARRDFAAAYAKGFRAIAIVSVHGYRNRLHEEQAGALARAAGFEQVSLSHQASSLIKVVARGDTTVVDAYLSPILRRYVERVSAALPGVNVLFMQSNGGLTAGERFRGKDAILSGPAGGIVGMVAAGKSAGCQRLIGFDMGGTSTDVSHFAGSLEREYHTLVAGVRLTAPMMAIHTIAAGGGSVLAFEDGRFRVGPESAGANPGPACYRRGGPLTVTDCNVLLGRIQANAFPAVFGESGREPIDVAVVREKFAELAARIAAATGIAHTPEQVAEGFLKVAVANMANAIKFISVERGHDVTGYVLNCFGGAGGQHACRVAETLGMSRVLVHPLAGVLSAFGMGQAALSTLLEQSLELELANENLPAAAAALDELAGRACAAVAAQGIEASRIALERRAHLKYRGTDTALVVGWGAPEAMRDAFAAAYRQRFSFLLEGLPLIIDAVSVEATGHDVGALPQPVAPAAAGRTTNACAREQVEMVVAGARAPVPLFDRADLEPGAVMDGPAIVVDPQSTTVVEPGWRARVLDDGSLLLERHADATHQPVRDGRPDPVMLEVFNNLFMSIAEQMGVALANTASSVNIKERLDFSCALFDGQANLIANAPHMPVHLGSMGDSVRTIAQRNAGRMQRGDVYVLNDPYNGGTHLPDVTVVTPVFLEDSTAKPDFFVASRGHHADIGGITPGSMPPFSKSAEEEGVLLDNFRYVSAGRADDAGLLARLTGARYPARNPAQNLADLRAQIAANEKGVQELRQMVAHFGERTVKAYMQHVQDNAEAAVRRAIGALKDGAFRYEMDSGAVIAVRVTIGKDRQSATIDFSGTSAEQDSNFNAPSSVVTAAVLYVFRMLVDSDIPLNAGCLKPLTLVIPEGSMLRPRPPAATVAGNVETSQCITDALIGAMGIMAASSGTMNNLTFGNAAHQYYETVSGGSGAGPGFAGTDVVQVHMTNSRLTDPEVLELRFPVRIEAHAIRKGSGGRGRWCGGNGAVRRIRFLQPMTAAILSGHRRIANFGMAGGEPGGLGRTWIERADGTIEELAYADQTEVGFGDVLVLETPGGGGYGRADAPHGAM